MTPLLMSYPISVAILYTAGDSLDIQDTMQSANAIKNALKQRGHLVRTIEVNQKNWRKAIRIAGDVVFNLVEDDNWILYSKVGISLEMLGRAQMGHDIRSFIYSLKKTRVKRRMLKEKINTPKFRVFNRRSKISEVRGLEYPLIVKPSGQHGGIGISQDSVVIDKQELKDRVKYLFKTLPGEVIAEEYIEGREVHVTVVGNGNKLVVLPFCEMEFRGEFSDNWNVLTYDAKWDTGSWEYWGTRISIPNNINRKLEAKLEKMAKAAFRAFNCRDVARMDIRVDNKDHCYLVDVNMSPSLNKYDSQDSTLKSVESLGWTYPEFIETVVAMTYKRVYGRLPHRIKDRHLMLSAGFVK